MAFVYCDKIGGKKKISSEKLMKVADLWISYHMIHLPKGSIKKLIDRNLTYEDNPVELKEE